MAENEAQSPGTQRLVSLDAYRGFIMLAMASAGFGFAEVYKKNTALKDCPVMKFLAYQFDHVEWVGCGFWDLIQPAFMFMVGVSMAYSYAKREAGGQSAAKMLGHAVWRSIVLILLGIFLSTGSENRLTNFTFVNVLVQIGLGYTFLFLLRNFKPAIQFGAAMAILIGYWAAFQLYPAPGAEFNYEDVGVTQQWKDEHLAGVNPHWHKNANFASRVDLTFMNLFPRSPDPKTGETRFTFNKGGYQTLNFVPSLATMIFGLLAGGLLRSGRSPRQKLGILVGAGLLALAVGLGLAETVCPLVKRIWTPSWAIFSTGWTVLMLAGFYGVIDLAGYRRWAFPLLVVGMNSIAIYCMSQLLKPWIKQSLNQHVVYYLRAGFGGMIDSLLDPMYLPIVERSANLCVLWLICYWMYRQKIFIRI